MRVPVGRTLVIGATGYVGGHLAVALRAGGRDTLTTSRRRGVADVVLEGPVDLDRLLEANEFDQIVHLPQLGAPGSDLLIRRVDGPRWVVFSSAQLASGVPAPDNDQALRNESVALSRGATVLRPTMIFGRDGDRNVSRSIRLLLRFHVSIVVGDGRQLVQPVHVDDVAALVLAHANRPTPGLFGVGGDAPITMHALARSLREATGRHLPVLRVRTAWLRPLGHLPVAGLRGDQILRLSEDKAVDTSGTREAFGWEPRPLPERLREAVDSVRCRLR